MYALFLIRRHGLRDVLMKLVIRGCVLCFFVDFIVRLRHRLGLKKNLYVFIFYF